MKLREVLSPYGLGSILEALLRFGFISGAAVSVAIGHFLLALVLALVAAGMFLRVWRLRRTGQQPRPKR